MVSRPVPLLCFREWQAMCDCSQIGADIAWDVERVLSEFDVVWNGVLCMTFCTRILLQRWLLKPRAKWNGTLHYFQVFSNNFFLIKGQIYVCINWGFRV